MQSICFEMLAALEKWNVSNIIQMYGMFEGATRFSHSLERWDVSHVEDLDDTFPTRRVVAEQETIETINAAATNREN